VRREDLHFRLVVMSHSYDLRYHAAKASYHTGALRGIRTPTISKDDWFYRPAQPQPYLPSTQNGGR
jgi:hypothetical protein